MATLFATLYVKKWTSNEHTGDWPIGQLSSGSDKSSSTGFTMFHQAAPVSQNR